MVMTILNTLTLGCRAIKALGNCPHTRLLLCLEENMGRWSRHLRLCVMPMHELSMKGSVAVDGGRGVDAHGPDKEDHAERESEGSHGLFVEDV